MIAPTMIREYAHGLKVEYRAYQATWGMWLEHRELKNDGTTYNDKWYPITDRGWLDLMHNSPEILTTLLPHLEGISTLTPRG